MPFKFSHLIFISYIFLIGFKSNAQEYYTHHGLLVDSVTQKPISFAHIKMGQFVSVSNQHGHFFIKYNKTDVNNIVRLSCIGYKSKELVLSALIKSNVAFLAQEVKLLNEIVISQLTAQTILKRAEKKGLKNYSTPKYLANYILDQFVFFEDADSSIANSQEVGVLINRGLDTTGVYPKFAKENQTISTRFLEFDTIPSQLTTLTKKRNTVTAELAYSYDPVRIGLLKQFHAVPTMFSKGFYNNTDLNIISILEFDDREYYLISVFPKSTKYAAIPTKEESRQLALYKEQIKAMAAKNGRTMSNDQIDSLFSKQFRNKSLADVSGFFLVDAKTYGIVHALIKVSTFDQTGKLFAKLHISTSYTLHNKSYYLQNLDILLKRTSPGNIESPNLYYLVSLNISDFRTKKTSKPIIERNQSDGLIPFDKEIPMRLNAKNIESFLRPVKDCASCKNNPLVLFGQMFE